MIFSNPLIQSLMEMVNTNPDFPILRNNTRKITAGDLYVRSNQAASGLLSCGFKKNDVVVIATEPGETFLEIMYAVILLQGKIAIIDPEMGRENYAAKMNQLQPQWMFIDSRLLFLQEHPALKNLLMRMGTKIPEISLVPGVRLISVGRNLPVFRKHISYRHFYKESPLPAAQLYARGHTGNIIIYTSGTLSVPKGVIHTGYSLGSSIRGLKKLLSANQHSVVGASLPHFMLLGITAGMQVKMKRKHLKTSTEINWIEKENIGVLFGPPSDYLPMIRYCEKNNRELPACLQHILLGSAPVHIRFLNRLIAVLPVYTQITCIYGMTENLLVCTVDGRQKAQYKGNGDLLGKPVGGVSIKIEYDGEILVQSDQLFSRYFHEEGRAEWHASGDLGDFDEQGNLILRGRKKEMIIRRNMNIYPALYENTIKNIKGVEEAAIVGVYDEKMEDEKIYLALEGTGLNLHLIRRQLNYGKYSIDKEAMPDYIFEMEIPRKGRQNKIDRFSIIEHIKKNAL